MKSSSEDPFTDHGTSGVKVNGHVLPATTNGLATPMKTALTTYPLFLEVRNVSVDENGKSLPNIMYEAAFKAPSLNVEWSVKYRFAHFRDIFHALEPHCVYAGDDAQRRQESGALEMTSAFPRTHTRRSLGIPLTERQLQERTALLGRWLRELLSKRGKLPIPMQSTVCSFMKLDEKLGDKIGMIVVSKPPKGTAATSEGTADASGSADGGGRDVHAHVHAHANGGIVKPTWTDKVRVLLRLGIPVLQHKHRKSKMGALSTRPRILRMYDASGGGGGDDAVVGPSLYLIEGPSNDGGDWAIGLSMSASDIISVSAGGRGTETLAASMKKKGEAYARQAEQRCLSIVAADGSQWDLEVSQLWLNCMTAFDDDGGRGGGAGAGGDKGGGRRRAFSEEEDLPSVSLRDQLVGFLNELLTAEGTRQASQPPPTAAEGAGARDDEAPFIASRSFQGTRSGYVFKAGAVGVGYYIDHGPFGAAKGGGVKKKRSFFG